MIAKLLLLSVIASPLLAKIAAPKPTIRNHNLFPNKNSTENGYATCRDPDIARAMNTAMTGYIHNMDGLSRSILQQIQSMRKAGTWLVHAQVISGSQQGRDWQTTTNSDIFSLRSPYSCFYHDMQTYILVLRTF